MTPAPTAYAATVAPGVAGKARVGSKVRLTGATAANFTPAPAAVSVQWTRNGKKIKGATKASYEVGRADAGAKLKAKITVSGSLP